MELPTFGDADTAVTLGTATSLEQFIFDNEPAGNEDSFEFRNGLINLLNYITEKNGEGIFYKESEEELEFYNHMTHKKESK